MSLAGFANDDGPLRADELPRNLWSWSDASETAVAASAWEPGAGAVRPQHAPRQPDQGGVDREIFNSVMETEQWRTTKHSGR
jgi:hypothetical protein